MAAPQEVAATSRSDLRLPGGPPPLGHLVQELDGVDPFYAEVVVMPMSVGRGWSGRWTRW